MIVSTQGSAAARLHTRTLADRKATGEEKILIVSKRLCPYFDGIPAVVCIDHHITRWRIAERELQRLAQEDTLTRISNRRHFQTETAHARHYGEALTIRMLDIDHFKLFNDTWGHPPVDEVLIEAVQRIRASLRDTDILARWGDEELLPHTSMRKALHVAERLRGHLAEQPIATSSHQVPVSIGIAQRMHDEPPDLLVSRADATLYHAKNEGRHRVVMAVE